MIFRGQLHAPPGPESARTAPQIHYNVKDAAGADPHQLALSMFGLKVQSAQRPLGGAALIVLHEGCGNAGRGKLLPLPRFHEESASVPENLWLDEHHVLNRRLLKFHRNRRITVDPAP